jgi:hypothetical protein
MNIFNELPDIEILDKQIAEAERLSDVLSLPRKPSTNIEEIFDDNLNVLSDSVKKKMELFQRIDYDVQAETLVSMKISSGQITPL